MTVLKFSARKGPGSSLTPVNSSSVTYVLIMIMT